jgi:hypothetical protein
MKDDLDLVSGIGSMIGLTKKQEETLEGMDEEEKWKIIYYRKTMKIKIFLYQKEKVLKRKLVAKKFSIADSNSTEVDKKLEDEEIQERLETRLDATYRKKKLNNVVPFLREN